MFRVVKCNLLLWCAAEFSASLLQSHMIFRNHYNKLISAQETFLIITIKVKLLHVFVETVMRFIFQDPLMNRKLERTACIWNRNICNIINVNLMHFCWIKIVIDNLKWPQTFEWQCMYQTKKCNYKSIHLRGTNQTPKKVFLLFSTQVTWSDTWENKQSVAKCGLLGWIFT